MILNVGLQLALLRRSGSQRMVHKHIGVNVCPGEAACLDGTLGKLKPNKMQVSGISLSENTQMDEVMHAGFPNRVHKSLALRQHCDYV